MTIFIFFLFFSFFTFLFSLYRIGKEDIVLIRKNISLEQLFNIAFKTIAWGLFSSRLFYVIFHPSSQFLNPIIFIAFPNVPGLSLFGGILGGVLFILYTARLRKLPTARIIDLLSVALLSAFPFGFIGSIFISPGIEVIPRIIFAGVYTLVYFFFIYFFYPSMLRGNIKDGTITAVFLITTAIFIDLMHLFLHLKGIFLFFQFQDIISVFVIISSIIFLLQSEKGKREQ